MDKKELKRLVELRNYVIEYYRSLENPGAPSSMVKTSDVAYTCESIVRSMDDLLKPHVNFSNSES